MLCRASRCFGGAHQRFQLEPNDPRFSLFIGGIAGFEFRIDEMSCIAKLAQDKGIEHARLACEQLENHKIEDQHALLNELVEAAFTS